MNTQSTEQNKDLINDLQSAVNGDVLTDPLSRVLYATDGSIYEILPQLVVLPKSTADVVATVNLCNKHKVPVTARGAGTGLAGGCVNQGVIIDFTRYMNRIIDINVDAGTVVVEPGLVLDELNAELAKHGRQVDVDVATSSRATLGGMIANNSCGAHSIVSGRTVDHLISMDTVMADGSTCTWGKNDTIKDNPLAAKCEQVLLQAARDNADEIAARYPKVMRSNAGYALDRLVVDDQRVNSEALLCGSEGTLCIVVQATMKLSPLPKNKGLMVIHFDNVFDAMGATPTILEKSPAAVELVDRLILDATKENASMARRRWFIEGDPEALLVVEILEEDQQKMAGRFEDLAQHLKAQSIGYAHTIITEPAKQLDVWEIRKAGLGLLMSKPGESQPYPVIEDAAVDPANLRAYVERLTAILNEEGITRIGYYAHASAGCLHIRPTLNLKKQEDVDRLYRIGDKVSSLVLEFGGTMTAEHGDGIVRASWMEKMYGPKITAIFNEIKDAFDPGNILNPGKMVKTLPMTENLRYGQGFEQDNPPTILDFSAHGGMAGLANMCSGVGQCRQKLVGTMCPSYTATGQEKHSTRARANALRIALSNRGLLKDLADPLLDEVMDLCLACKACKTECPTGTDISKLRAEWLAARHRRLGVPRRSKLVAASTDLAKWGSMFAPFSNMVAQNKITRAFMEYLYGLDRRVPPPKYVRKTFKSWFRQHRKLNINKGKTKVVYFIDCWVNHHIPRVGIAAVTVLEALGCEVIVPPTKCCGRPMISKGMLPEAKLLAEENVRILTPYAQQGIPIVGTEPSCILTFVDEVPQFVRTPQAKAIASLAKPIESYIAEVLEEDPNALKFKDGKRPVIYHGHCHQKSLVGTAAAMKVLAACTNDAASEIDSGCCGMAGSFGHEVEHYEVSKAVGEQRLFPAVRNRGDANVAVSGFSCRHQVGHHTGVHPKHPVEYIAEALA